MENNFASETVAQYLVIRLQEQFRDYPDLLRMAVSLGRRAGEPLEEFSAMFMSDDNEIFSLKLHPLQVGEREWGIV